MTHTDSDLKVGDNSNRRFLRHTRAPRKQAAEGDRLRLRPDADLADIYTDLQVGQDFIDGSLAMFAAADQLLAILIEIDSNQAGAENMASIRKDLAAVVQIICQNENGCWGVLDYPIFACLFQDAAAQDGIQVVQRVKQQLAGLRGDTLTIGVAGHPCLDYRRAQIFENAHKALEHARFFGPDSLVVFDAVSLNISGDQQYDKGNFKAAIDEFKRGLQLDPKNANLLNSTGVCFGVLEQYEDARRAFENALTAAPKDAMVLYNLGLVHLLTSDRSTAADFFLKADQIDDTIFEVAYQLGRLCVDRQQFEQARVHLEKATRMDTAGAAAFTALGECYLGLNDKLRAVAAFKKAIQLNGNEAGALSELGWLYHQMGKNIEIAELFCRQSVSIAPDSGLYRFRLGRLLESLGQLDEAREELDRATELGFDPHQPAVQTAVDTAEIQSGRLMKGSAA